MNLKEAIKVCKEYNYSLDFDQNIITAIGYYSGTRYEYKSDSIEKSVEELFNVMSKDYII